MVFALATTAASRPPSAQPTPVIGTPGPGTVSVVGSLTYDGQPTANASTAGSALSANFNKPVNVEFFWNASGGKINQPLSIPIQTARLQVYYLGLSVYTKDQTLSPPSVASKGSVNLTADFTLNRYLIEGVYELSGTLIQPNGTNVWSENFYLKISAPWHLTAANIGLGLVGVYEVYSIATVGRWLTGSAKKADAPASGSGGPDDSAAPAKGGKS